MAHYEQDGSICITSLFDYFYQMKKSDISLIEINKVCFCNQLHFQKKISRSRRSVKKFSKAQKRNQKISDGDIIFYEFVNNLHDDDSNFFHTIANK